MSIPVYMLARVPGAADPVEWTSICHQRHPFVVIDYHPYRWLSRWRTAERKCRFIVSYCNGKGHLRVPREVSSHQTLAAAEKAARRLVTNRSNRD